MAVDLHMLEMEASHEGGDGNRTEPEAPTATTRRDGGDAAEAVVVYKKGAWSKEEDEKLRRAVDKYGLRNWVAIEKISGLGRPAKNCRLRWLNYLRPNLKKYPFTQEEEELIFQLHSKYGNSWSRIASKLPGRSDNEIKNFWHKKSKKRHFPIYPTTKENHKNLPNEANAAKDEYFPKNDDDDDDIPTNYPKHTLHSTSTHSPQFQPSTPNIVNMSIRSNYASINSLQTAISTPQPQFHSSPVSSRIQQSPANHLTDQTTPTSQTQNLLLSPQPRTQSTETTFSIHNTPPHIQAPSMRQTGGSSNEFIRKPPILSSPQGPLRRFSRATSKLSPNSAHSVVNASSAILPTDSSMQVQFSSAIESPKSPLKLKFSPRVPALCSVQMNTHTTESFFQSSLSIPDSTVQLSSSTAAVVSLSSSELIPSSCGHDLPPIQPMTVDTDNIIPHESSQTIETEPPSIQVESDTNSSLDIMKELREAQARVKFLKKKLRLRRISSKRKLLKGSSETTNLTEGPLDGNSSESTTKECMLHTSSRTEIFLDDILRLKASLKNSRKKDMLKKIPRRKGDIITGDREENRLCKLQKREHSESKKCTRGSIESEKATRDENPETKTMPEESFQREEYSLGEIFKRENSMTFQEQRHSIDFFDQLNIQNTLNPPNLNSFDNKLCHFQGPEGKCLNECSTIDGLYSESSTLLQDSSLHGDLFGQRSGIEDELSSQRHVSLRDAFGPIYSQGTATTLVNEISRLSYHQPDQGGYFGYSFGQEISDSLERKLTEDGLMDDNLAEKSTLCESNLLLNQYPSSDLLDSCCLVSTPIMEQECSRVEQFSLQTPGGENPKLCEPSMLMHQSPAANPIDNLVDSGYLVGFEQECPQGEQYFLQSSAGEFDRSGMKTECTSRETWKQELSREQSLMHGLLVDNLWPEGQEVSQDHTFSTNRFHSGVVDLMESKNWNDDSGCGHTDYLGEVLKHEAEHDQMNTMSEELSSLLEFFPTTNQTLEWYNTGNAIPDTKASDEFDMGLDLQRSSTSQLPLTTADYL